MENNLNNSKNENDNAYDVDVKITEKLIESNLLHNGDGNFNDHKEFLPNSRRHYDSFFIPYKGDAPEEIKNNLTSADSTNANKSNIKDTRNMYNRCLTKQQLSLVEEESTQDFESMPSQNFSDLSPENSEGFLELSKTIDDIDVNLNRSNSCVTNGANNNFIVTRKLKVQDRNQDPKSYESFYGDFRTENALDCKTNLSSTIIHSDALSKDSGYPESALAEEKTYKSDYSLPNSTSIFREKNAKISTHQPKSLESITINKNNDNNFKNHEKINSEWNEPLNHSRLLYKDFFLKREGCLVVPQNSPSKINVENNEIVPEVKAINTENEKEDKLSTKDYPSYLLNSTTKAYTSKVIEDYRKEIQAIDNLHELTLKDIKTETVSPTPLYIENMFEENRDIEGNQECEQSYKGNEDSVASNLQNKNTKAIPTVNNKQDVTKVSSKELIQNYYKVKGSDYPTFKNSKKIDRKFFRSSSDGEECITPTWNWKNKGNNDHTDGNIKTFFLRNQIKNVRRSDDVVANKIPLSARIDSVQNDKDVDSWMSMSAPSPRVFEIDEISFPSTNKTVSTNKTEMSSDKTCSNSTKNDKAEETSVKSDINQTVINEEPQVCKPKELASDSTVLDIYSMLKEIESYGEKPFHIVKSDTEGQNLQEPERLSTPKDNFMEIFEFLEKVEQSANEALSVVTDATPPNIPKLEALLRLPQTELAQRLVTASLQLEERSCCIALLQESLSNHKEQMIAKISALEKQSLRNVAKVKQDCETAIKRHQSFIDQLINDKKTLNHRIEQLVDERRSLEERWKRSAQTLEERYKLELKNQHDKMVASQQVARQRWVRQKAEKIKELTVKGLEGELREMADRQQKEVADLKMTHAEQISRMQVKQARELEELRRSMEEEKEAALIKERHLASTRLEKQILELELTYQEQRTKLVNEMRAENERLAVTLGERERTAKQQIEEWRLEQEKIIEEKRTQTEAELAKEKDKLRDQLQQQRKELEDEFERYKREFEGEQQLLMKRKLTEISAQHKIERDREIEKAIESMEAEAQQGRKELQEALRRNKEQYEAELKELAETEQATLKRYQDAQARIRQTETKCAELEVTISQLETRNRILVEKNTQLEERAEEVRANCENMWKGKLEQCQAEMVELRKTHDEQMHQLYAKVKVAVARKDSAIQALTREQGKAQEKITLLERKLQQQRKDYLKQK